VQVLHGLFYVLLQLLVVAAIILSFIFYCKFYCKFYCSCDPSLTTEYFRLECYSVTQVRLFRNSIDFEISYRSSKWHKLKVNFQFLQLDSLDP